MCVTDEDDIERNLQEAGLGCQNSKYCSKYFAPCKSPFNVTLTAFCTLSHCLNFSYFGLKHSVIVMLRWFYKKTYFNRSEGQRPPVNSDIHERGETDDVTSDASGICCCGVMSLSGCCV